MNYSDTMTALKKAGTAQNVKVYKRHGAGDHLFGVAFSKLRKLEKKIKVDHDLAQQLWKSRNADAQTLAILVADPSAMKASEADAWVKEISYYLLADMLGGLVAKTSFAQKTAEKWMKSPKEFVRQCGYVVLSAMLRNEAKLSDGTCRGYLERIENEIHGSENRARHSMIMAVAAIGIYRRELSEEAIAAAGRIGKVEVDHGETSCKTPDAADYIKKALARPKKKTAAKGKKKAARKVTSR